MSFAEVLRDRNSKKIKQPVSFGFAEFDWRRLFDKLNDGSDSDRDIFYFGIIIFRKLQRIRAALNQLQRQTASVDADFVKLWLARNLNCGFIQLSGVGALDLKHKRFVSVEEIGYGRNITTPTGARFTTQEALESLVDASRHLLRAAMSNKGYGTSIPEAPIFDPDHSLQNAAQLAQLYNTYENLWQSALWKSIELKTLPSMGDIGVSEENSELSRYAAVDLARRTVLYYRDIEEARSIPLSSDTYSQKLIFLDAEGKLSTRHLGEIKPELMSAALSLAYQRISIIEHSSRSLLSQAHG